MWRWRQSVVFNSSSAGNSFFKEVLLWVFCTHMLCIISIGIYNWLMFQPKRYAIRLHDKNVTYVLTPTKGMQALIGSSLKTSGSQALKSKVIDYATYKKVVDQAGKIGKQISSKSIPEKAVSKTILSSKTSLKNKKKMSSVAHQKKQKKKLSNKKSKNVKSSAQAVVSKQNKSLTDNQKAIENGPDIAAQVPSNLQSNVQVEADSGPQAVLSAHIQELLSQGLPEDVVALDPDEYASKNVAEKIRQSILEHWVAPIGLSDDSVCHLEITVNDQGKATNVTIVKSSGAYACDVQARRAVLAATYPSESFNTTFITELGV